MNSNDSEPHVPSVEVLVRVVSYLVLVVLIGMSFSYSLEMLNVLFGLGIVWFAVNLLLVLLLVRHIWIKHLTQDSPSPTKEESPDAPSQD
jgi:multisubunit Na+/H+ antiporter MnhC subunit